MIQLKSFTLQLNNKIRTEHVVWCKIHYRSLRETQDFFYWRAPAVINMYVILFSSEVLTQTSVLSKHSVRTRP